MSCFDVAGGLVLPVRDSRYHPRHDLGGSLALTGEVAFHSSNDILDLLKEHDISDVDVAYRESTTRDNNETLLILYVPHWPHTWG